MGKAEDYFDAAAGEEVARLRQRIVELERELASRRSDDEDSSREYTHEEEESFRRSIIARAVEGLCVCHKIERPPHIYFTVWNARMCEISGYTREEINQFGWHQAVLPSPGATERARALVARIGETEDMIGEEWEFKRKDGQTRVVSLSTSALLSHDGLPHVLALIHDVTDRRRAENRLRRSEALYQATFERAPIGIVHLDREGRLTSVNPRYAEMLGYSTEALLGRQMRDLTHPDDALASAAQVARLSSGEQSVSWHERQIRKDGSTVWVHATVGLFSGPERQHPQAIGVVEDTTTLRRAEQERRRLEAQLQHSQ
jgi:PAS domain S-box-containing protein